MILGGGDAFSSFQPFDVYQDQTIKSVIRQIKKVFPSIHNVYFDTFRSGRIEATQDLMPMIGRDDTFNNHLWVQ